MTRRFKLLLAVTAFAYIVGAGAYINYIVGYVPEGVLESAQTMRMADSMRHTFKVSLLNRRAAETYLQAQLDGDSAKIDKALNYLKASLGFVYSGYIDNTVMIETLVPLVRQNISDIENHGLAMPKDQLASMMARFGAIHRHSQNAEQGIWIKFQSDFVEFQRNEGQVQLAYQAVAVVSVIFLMVITGLFLRQRALTKAVKRGEEQFSLAMQGANDGLWDWNLLSGEVYYSPRWCRMVGYEPEDLEATLETWEHLVDPADKDRILDAVQAYLSGETAIFETEFQMRHRDGHWVTILSRAFKVVDKGKPVRLVGTHVDITALKDTQRELIRSRNRLEETVAERTHELREAIQTAQAASKTKSQFLATMSHELRTPLNAIIGYSEMLMEEFEDEDGAFKPSDHLADLEKIRGSGKHLLHLINDILDISKIEAGQVELFLEHADIGDVVDSIAMTSRPLIDKNRNTLTVVKGEALGAGLTDVTRLRQILFNLVANAAKFTRDGEVTVTAERVVTDNSACFQFAISDTGIGVEQDKLADIFEPFIQADASTTRRYGGTGLGLPITKRLCEMMGGEITASSTPGLGTVFTVRLPLEVLAESAA